MVTTPNPLKGTPGSAQACSYLDILNRMSIFAQYDKIELIGRDEQV
jgi:hypothetical protein